MEQVDQNTKMSIPLESFLVSEFRAYQTLLKLTKQERMALVKADILTLAGIVEQKDSLMDEIHRLEKGRSQVVREWAERTGFTSSSPTIQDLVHYMPQPTAQRLERIRSGILSISVELRDMTRGNQALAVSALERLDHMRTLILSFDQPTDHYVSSGKKKDQATTASWKLEERV
ncbi:MAG: flagellar protein FlgN [Anaerolineales bacterium]|nr:flagellar protein FlgN [Anaerolineales bacterium]